MAAATNRATGRPAPSQGDRTALQAQALEEARDDAAAEAAAQRAEQAKVEEHERKNTVIRYKGLDTPLPEVVEDEAELENPTRVVIIKYEIDRMAFGREIIQDAEYDERGNITQPAKLGGINFLSFKEGRKYELPKALADHLDERGYLFH